MKTMPKISTKIVGLRKKLVESLVSSDKDNEKKLKKELIKTLKKV